MPREQFQKRLLDIAAGRYKPKRNEPKIWFSSVKSFSEVLNENNVRLLKIIEEEKPDSIKELSDLSGRAVSNLSRTLKTLERYGIVELTKNKKSLKPLAKATEFDIRYTA
ncbi:MAG: MarR family transcriptional regulator [Balneolaceae bacterium]|nr:MarR family transcriptional regulator [Balneolaceae bacterium]